MADQTLTVKIVGDEKDLLRAFRSSSQATQRFSASFGTFLKGALVFEGVRAGVHALGSALRAGTSEFSEMQKVAAQTQAVLASTGGVAGVSARDVERLSGSIARLSGIDDELIQRGANLILTFKQVRNEAGKGNAIFDRATRAAVDLSVAGFGSIETTAKQLGKALNDPIRGMTALGRAGVTFTQRQRDQIKALVESGRALEAQRVILKEVESQVGGSARALGETLPGQLSKLREAFRNAFGNLVGVVATPLASALGSLASFIPKIEQSVEQISATVGPALTRLVEAFTSRLPQLERIAGSVLEPLREHVVPVLRDVAQVVGTFWANIVAVFSARSGQIRQILANLGQVLANVWTVARPTIVFLFTKVLPVAAAITITALEKITGVARVLSDVFVRVVSTIVRALDVFLGGISRVADAASHLPIVGDSFKGIADKVNASRESLRTFADQLDAIDGRQAQVSIAVDVTTGRREEGALGRSSDAVKKATEDATKQAKADIDAQRVAAREVTQASSAATSETKKAKTAAERQREAFDALMATIGLRRDRAAATAGLRDDIAAAEQTKRALEAQLKVQKGNVELQRQLLQVNQDLAALRREQRQGRQFEALGLTAEGEKRVPGVGALRSRLAKVRELIKGTVLDTSKTRSQLAAIAKVLSGQFGAVGREVRQAILGMFNDITGALDQGSKTQGPLTKFQKGGFGKLIEDVTGLTPEQIKALRQSFAQFGAGGTVPGRGVAAFGMAFPAPVAAAAGGTTREEIHIYIDGEEVESRVTKRQQRKRGRSAASRRGVRPGIGGV